MTEKTPSNENSQSEENAAEFMVPASSEMVRGRRRRVSTGTARSMGSQLLGLSLFIMLLAFFIVLNAISAYEETKVRPIIESLGFTFASRILEPQVDERPSVTKDAQPSIHEGDTLDRIQALFNSQLPGHETVKSERKGTMYVKLPFDEFEQAVMAAGQQNALDDQVGAGKFLKGFFLPTLVALVETENTRRPYRMDILLNMDDNPAHVQNTQPQQLASKVRRLNDIAAKLESAGLPTNLVSIGLQKGETDMVELLFRIHIPFNPAENESDESGQQ